MLESAQVADSGAMNMLAALYSNFPPVSKPLSGDAMWHCMNSTVPTAPRSPSPSLPEQTGISASHAALETEYPAVSLRQPTHGRDRRWLSVAFRTSLWRPGRSASIACSLLIMKSVRGGDDHAVQIRNLQELPELLCDHLEPELVFDALQLAGANSAYRCELDIFAVAQCRHGVCGGSPAGANKAKSGGA